MTSTLDEQLRQWLNRLSDDWEAPLGKTVEVLGAQETANRIESFPKVSAIMRTIPLDMEAVRSIPTFCWPMHERFLIQKLKAFCEHPGSVEIVTNFVNALGDDRRLADRIDRFIDDAVDKGIDQRHMAGLVASVVLTATRPDSFVDFRQKRWAGLAKELDYDFPSQGSYGERIIAAGDFARAISLTPTFREHWQTDHPLWTVAGICWHGMWEADERPEGLPPPSDNTEGYEEGAFRLHLHLKRERNSKLVADAKREWLSSDPLLRCEVCRFSFVERYGELGKSFVEGHHRTPLKDVAPGTKTSVADLAPVCANCHRMLHRADDITIVKLKKQLLENV